MEKPEALLGKGERQAGGTGLGEQRRAGGGKGGEQGGLKQGGLGGEGGMLEDRAQRQVDSKGLTKPSDQLRGQERVASQVEEVVVEANARYPKHLHP